MANYTMSFSEAGQIYTRTMQDMGFIPSYPSASSSELIKGVWYLRNSNGHLAKVGTRSKAVINPPVYQ